MWILHQEVLGLNVGPSINLLLLLGALRLLRIPQLLLTLASSLHHEYLDFMDQGSPLYLLTPPNRQEC